jgi:multidrug efflux pump subunit AcrA (membrane-fusion protein)
METLLLRNTSEIRFIRIFFQLLATIVGISVMLLFVLNLNDTVPFTNGEIISSNPQVRYVVPFEATTEKVLVREGEFVRKNDTLIVLQNQKLSLDFAATAQECNALIKKLEVVRNLLGNTENRINALDQQESIAGQGFAIDRKRNTQELQSLRAMLHSTQQQYDIVKNRLATDSTLYKDRVIAKLEINESYNKYLDYRKTYLDIRNKLMQQEIEAEKLMNGYHQRKNDTRLARVGAESEYHHLRQSQLTLEAEIASKRSSLNFYRDELSKLYIVAKSNGTVTNLFNTKQSANVLNKGDLLAITAPKEETFYAKVAISQDGLKYIQKRQPVHLKLDAYYYYQYGIMRGEVGYVSSTDENNNFYVLVKIKEKNKNIRLKGGYLVKGDIIIERMKLYRYILKKLFKKMDVFF